MRRLALPPFQAPAGFYWTATTTEPGATAGYVAGLPRGVSFFAKTTSDTVAARTAGVWCVRGGSGAQTPY